MDFLYKLSLFFKTKKSFYFPNKSSILIYDNSGSDIMLQYLDEFKPEILWLRNEILYLRFLIPVIFSKNLKTRYIDRYIKYVNPKVIITFIDNNSDFYLIKSRHPKIITVLIQNGIRTKYSEPFVSKSNSNYHVDHMFLFGKNICNEFSKIIKGNTYPIGSFKNNYYKKNTENNININAIAFISTYTEIDSFRIGDELFSSFDFMKVENELLSFLIKFCKENNKTINIVLRNRPENNLKIYLQELEFYKSIFVFHNFENYQIDNKLSSYEIVDKSYIVIGVDSTLLYESISRGKKTLIFSARKLYNNLDTYNFGWPGFYDDFGFFWANKFNEIIFNQFVHQIFKIQDERWEESLELLNYFTDIMNYDSDNSLFRKIIKKELVNF